MKKYIKQLKKIFIIFSLFMAMTLNVPMAHGDAWWGEGYRSSDWVLSHGGTIIHFKITGAGESDNYKAVLEQNGKYVEGEIGKKGKFDDAKNGVYTVSAYKGGTGRRDSKSGKKIATITVTAHAGETMHLAFKEDKSASFTTDYVKPRPKTVPVSPVIPQKPIAEPETPLPVQPITVPESAKEDWAII